MTDNIIIHPLKQLLSGTFLAKVTISALLSFCVFAQPAYAAEQEWWFDVEVILFERNVEVTSIPEKFEQSRLLPPENDHLDILTPYLHPDLSYLRAGLNYCRASSRQLIKKQYEQDFSFPKPVVEENGLQSPQEIEESPATVPATDNELVTTSDTNEAQRFQDKVAITDIFSKADNQNTIVESMEDSTQISSDQLNNETLGQQDNLEHKSAVIVDRPPIQIEFIEWQIPNELPCAYSEQIDPSFASVTDIKETELGVKPNDLITRVPVEINGVEWPQKRSAILLPNSTMRLNDLYEKIKKQRDITPILHLNWRQQVYFGRENGQTIRLFAGQNFADQFNAQGIALISDTDALINSLTQETEQLYIPEQELALLSQEEHQALLAMHNGPEDNVDDDIFAKIDNALVDDSLLNFQHVDEKAKQSDDNSDSALLSELWQLDGGITVYLRNVGRIPYLHIDSNLDYRQPVYAPKLVVKMPQLTPNDSAQIAIADNLPKQANYLQSVNFNQLRRVISKQVHYFDHPLFGMIVRIDRYRWPEIEEEADTNDSEL
jgi:hypothetical protein